MAREHTLAELVACVEREIGFREKVYPRWVNSAPPKLTQAVADLELGRMRAVRDRLLALQEPVAATPSS